MKKEEEKQQFECPFCTFNTWDFAESDQHYEEHITEYQSKQNDVFGKFSK